MAQEVITHIVLSEDWSSVPVHMLGGLQLLIPPPPWGPLGLVFMYPYKYTYFEFFFKYF